MRRYAMGIDIGTTGVKALLISDAGRIEVECTYAHNLISLKPGWAEEDAEIWWLNAKAAVKELLERCPEAKNHLESICCSGMVPAMVLLDKNGSPLRKTIQQNDARASTEIHELTEQIDAVYLFSRTGSRMNQQHLLPRLLWLKRNEPEIYSKIDTVMGSYDFIAYRLTGQKSMELNFAAESGLYDIHMRSLLFDLLTRYEIDASIFPTVHTPMEIIGHTLGTDGVLPAGIPVLAGTADHVASTLSAGIIDHGDLLIKFGGAGDILYCTDSILIDQRLYFDFHDIDGKYLINGCMAASGSLVKWFTHDIIRDDAPDALKILDQDANLLPPASDGLIILPYFVGEKTPFFDPNARGVIYGLTLSHTRAHIFRAILEAVIYGFRHHLEVLESIGCTPKHIIATNGGAKSKIWCQIAADVLNSEICSYPTHPGSALGAAFLAAMSTGIFTQWSDIRLFLTEPCRFYPKKNNVVIYEKSYQMYRHLYTQLQPLNDAEKTLY